MHRPFCSCSRPCVLHSVDLFNQKGTTATSFSLVVSSQRLTFFLNDIHKTRANERDHPLKVDTTFTYLPFLSPSLPFPKTSGLLPQCRRNPPTLYISTPSHDQSADVGGRRCRPLLRQPSTVRSPCYCYSKLSASPSILFSDIPTIQVPNGS